MHLFGKINIQRKESLNIWVAVSDLFRDTWSDIFWKFVERPGTLRSPCDHRHGRSASFCADALGPQALVLCACVLHVQVTCRGAQLCFPRLLLAQSGTFLSLSMNVKVRAAKLSDSEVLPPPSLTTREPLGSGAIHQITVTASQMLYLSLLVTSRMTVWSISFGLCVQECPGRENKAGRETGEGAGKLVGCQRAVLLGALSVLRGCCSFRGRWE